MNTTTYDPKLLQKALKRHAKALNIPSGSAEIFIERVLASTEASIKNKKIVTENDIKRIVAKELKKYHQDFAYVYKNHDKII